MMQTTMAGLRWDGMLGEARRIEPTGGPTEALQATALPGDAVVVMGPEALVVELERRIAAVEQEIEETGGERITVDEDGEEWSEEILVDIEAMVREINASTGG